MPATSIRDLVIKDDDIVLGTHGRSFWILDDITPLRQLRESSASATTLFAPQVATRFRWNKNTDTPLPPDEPAGENPPDGAIIDYMVAPDMSAPVSLEVLDASGKVVRRYASSDTAMRPADVGNIPAYWIRPTAVLSAAPGFHRFVWDLRYERPAVLNTDYPIAAILHDTPREPRGTWAMPGSYMLRLTANGRAYTQPLVVRMDPRVKTPLADLRQQFATATKLTELLRQDYDVLMQVRARRAQLEAARQHGDTVNRELDSRLARLEGGSGGRGGRDAASASPSLAALNGELAGLYNIIEGADAAPTTQALAAVADVERQLKSVLGQWSAVSGVSSSGKN